MTCRREVPAILYVVLVAVIACSVLGVGTVSPAYGEIDRALFIGLNYDRSGNDIPALRYAVADAKDLAALARGVMRVKDVAVLTDEAPTELPTADLLGKRIRSFLGLARPGENVLVFFSGHGTERAGKSFIVAGDGGTVALSDIRSWFVTSAAEAKVLMVDACHSGGARAPFPSGLGKDFFREALPGMVAAVQNMVTISACDVGEVAREAPIGGQGNGVFTHFVLAGMRDGAAAIDNEKEVRLMALFSHVARAVGDWGERTQHPRIFASGGDVTLVRNPSVPAGGPVDRKVPFTVFPVYMDQGSPSNHFSPSGRMGDREALVVDDNWKEGQYSGQSCVKFTYSPPRGRGEGSAGVFWQDPGGFDLTGAQRVTFVARGESGREVVEFKFGAVAPAVSGDSVRPAVGTSAVTLGASWNRYSIDLSGRDTSHVIGGFCCVAEAARNPDGCTFYLDDIQIEGEFRQRDLVTQRVDLALPTWITPPVPAARGHMVISRKAESFRGRLTLTGVPPDSSYLLNLNGKVRSPGNEELKSAQGKVTGQGEGYVDIAEVVADETGNVTYDMDFPLSPGVYDVKFFVKRMGTWDVVLANNFVRFAIPGGRITSPKAGQTVDRTFTVNGVVSGIPSGKHVWLAVRVGNLLWPKDPEIDGGHPEWTREVIEAGNPPGGRLSLLLLMVDSAGDQAIRTWFENGPRVGYPGLPGIAGSVQLDAVTDLRLQ